MTRYLSVGAIKSWSAKQPCGQAVTAADLRSVWLAEWLALLTLDHDLDKRSLLPLQQS